MLPLAHLRKKMGLGCFVAGTAVDANEFNSVMGVPGCLWKGDARIGQGW